MCRHLQKTGGRSVLSDPREPTCGAERRIPNTSHKHRCIFIHVPKAAGTSVKAVFDMPGRGHVAWAFYSLCYPELWRQYTSFAVVRNPWDRAVSAYHFVKMRDSYWHNALLPPVDHKRVRGLSFNECLTILVHDRELLKNQVWHPQTAWVARPQSLGGDLMVDRLLRFESLDTEFPQLCADLGVEPRRLPKINPSDRSRGYRQYYDGETRKLVERAYASDIETFRYTF